MGVPGLEAVEKVLLVPDAVSDLIDMAVERIQALRCQGPDKANGYRPCRSG